MKRITIEEKNKLESFIFENINKNFSINDLLLKNNLKKQTLVKTLDILCCRNGFILKSCVKKGTKQNAGIYTILKNK